MHQFTKGLSNDFQMCSFISKSGVDGSGLQISYLAADDVILPQHIEDSEFNKLFPLLYRRFQNRPNSLRRSIKYAEKIKNMHIYRPGASLSAWC